MTAVLQATTLPDFEDAEVEAAQVRITNAGDGLSEALKIKPVALHMDEVVYYVLKGTVTQINHKTIGKDEDEKLVRVHTVKASAISQVDGPTAMKMLSEAAEALAKAKAEADGQLMLDDEQAALDREAND